MIDYTDYHNYYNKKLGEIGTITWANTSTDEIKGKVERMKE